MKIKPVIILLISLGMFLVGANTSYAFWIWTPKSKTFVNPKFAVKDTPREQFNWAKYFFEAHEFQRAADEFTKLVSHYPDSDLAPEAQYYTGRSYEELAKYLFAFQNYQKTIDDYPYTKRLDEITERQYNIARLFQNKGGAKVGDLELSLSLERATMVYKKVIENNPFGKYADKALFNLASCYRKMFKHTEAIDAYNKIITDYPESPLVPEAKYEMAYTKYEASLKPSYDQESTDEALKEFKEIAKTTAVPKTSDETNKLLSELKSKKAESIMQIAAFYERQGQYKSARLYYQDIVSNFSDTEAGKTAANRIANLKQKVKK